MELSVAMKRIPLAFALVLIIPLLVAAQGQIRDRRSNDRESANDSSSRNRVVSASRSNHVESDKASAEVDPKSTPSSDGSRQSSNQERARWGNTSVEIRSSAIERPPPSQTSPSSTATNQLQDNAVAK